MAKSSRFRELERRLLQIRRHFVPPINISGNYTILQRDRMRAYRLLIHAEFEAYIEDIAKLISSRAYAKWQSTAKLSYVMTNIVCFIRQERDKPTTDATSFIHWSYTEYTKILTNNNGIKEENLKKIFRPLGLSFDQTLLNTLSSYGGHRGQVAHSSAKTQTPIDPATELATVDLIVNGLEKVDEDIFSL